MPSRRQTRAAPNKVDTGVIATVPDVVMDLQQHSHAAFSDERDKQRLWYQCADTDSRSARLIRLRPHSSICLIPTLEGQIGGSLLTSHSKRLAVKIFDVTLPS